jgi:hypothetical protein
MPDIEFRILGHLNCWQEGSVSVSAARSRAALRVNIIASLPTGS